MMSPPQFGATLHSDGVCEWRVWAPRAGRVDLVFFDASGTETRALPMAAQGDGYYTCRNEQILPGQRYAFRLDGGSPRPDPASKWQPDGVHRPSAVWRAQDFDWTDDNWPGMALREFVLYELHVGTFTSEGTFAAIIPRLRELRDLGVTAIELMPVGQFPGERGWGYDGVFWYAVQQSYGGPTELQRLVDACHALGMAVILDVIYNHFGPEGNYFGEFAPVYTEQHHTPWGAAINYDGPASRNVRDFVLGNVRQWIRDFHFDGLRLDAIHAIHDDSPVHILAEIKLAASEESAVMGRLVHVIAESNLNDVVLLDSPAEGGYGLDAQWSDDFHHCVHTLLTGEQDGYYSDFDAPVTQLAKAMNEAFVHNGCFSSFRGREHGAPIGEHTGEQFIISIQTHDQVGNRARGDRFGTLLDPARQRLAAGLLLLAPYVPMLFMGEEYGETKPFPFFCDFGDEHLREAVRRGRREEFASFAWSGELPDPTACSTYESAILSWTWPEGSVHAGLRTLYRELLSLRRTSPALRDFKHHHSELVADSAGHIALLLRRGNPQSPTECLVVVFSLSSAPIQLSSVGNLPTEVLLYSEESRFCGSTPETTFDGELRPFAFAIFGSSKDVLHDDIIS